MRVNYRGGNRWCSHCGKQVKPEGLNCPDCGRMVRQAPRRSVHRAIFRGIAGLYSAPKLRLKTASAP